MAIVTAYLGNQITTSNIFYLFPSVFGSVFPDLVEGKPPEDKTSEEYQRWQKHHRQHSHWFVIYLVGLILSYFLWKILSNKYGYVQIANEILIGSVFFFAGCLLHLLQDAFCGQIPSLNPRQRFGVRLFKVGSTAETIVTIILLFIVVSVFLHRVKSG